MTTKQEIARRRLEHRLNSVLENILSEARRQGCANPMLFIEPECGVYVLDRDHPEYKNAANGGMGDRQKAVVMHLRALPPHTDAGGW